MSTIKVTFKIRKSTPDGLINDTILDIMQQGAFAWVKCKKKGKRQMVVEMPENLHPKNAIEIGVSMAILELSTHPILEALPL